jgi:hypothetical protein
LALIGTARLEVTSPSMKGADAAPIAAARPRKVEMIKFFMA